MIQPTCTPERCKLHDLLGGDVEECPNFMQNWFVETGPRGEGKPYLVNDCAPKRTMVMIGALEKALIGVQKSNEQQRNRVGDLIHLVCQKYGGLLEAPETQDHVQALPGI